MTSHLRVVIRTASVALLGSSLLAGSASGQDQRHEQFYFPGAFNWQFLANYPEAGRLFNAFDYGHAVLYEKLLTKPADVREELEQRQYDFLTTDLLVRPPRFAVAEEVIEPTYSKVVWHAKQMFDWAHLLHRQIYDVYADERLSPTERDVLIERLTDYYLSRPDYAFPPVPKAMALMDEQYFSQVFRKGFPKFNGLIWSYHWLQVGLYEPMIIGTTRAEKKAGVQATLARFWSMLKDAPANLPTVMPMTSAVAPRFSAAHPRAAVIFDNLHMMHDIISDILAADTVPRAAKRQVIYTALAEFRDTTRNVMTLAEWRDMGQMMGGIGAMGGPATGLLVAAPATLPVRGDMGEMQHPAAAAPAPDTAHHGMPAMLMPRDSVRPEQTRRPTDERPMVVGVPRPLAADAPKVKLLEAMLRDPVIRRRVQADPVLRRLGAAVTAPTPMPVAKPRTKVMPKPSPRRDTTIAKPMPPMPGMKHP